MVAPPVVETRAGCPPLSLDPGNHSLQPLHTTNGLEPKENNSRSRHLVSEEAIKTQVFTFD